MKRCEDCTVHRVLRQEGATMTSRAVNYETVDRATVLPRNYFDSIDGMPRDPNVEDIPHIETMKTDLSTSRTGH